MTVRASVVLKEMLSGPMTWKYAFGEALEFFAEICQVSWSGIKDEFSDVMFHFQMAFHCSTGIDFKLFWCEPTIRKMVVRFRRWEEIFKRHGLRFEVRYLANGGNPDRPHKVQAALEMARLEQGRAV